MYDRVLIPTDGSECADEAARHAVGIAERFDAELHVLNAVETHEYVAVNEAAVEKQIDIVEEEGRKAVKRVTEIGDEEDIETVEKVAHGSAHDVVLDYIEENRIDLVVMGTHGRTGVERMLLGSNTEKVVRSSDVPVFTVPSCAEDSYVYDSILVPTDGSPGSKAAVENAVRIADEYGSTVHVVYVIDVRVGSSTGVIPDVVNALEEEGERATSEVGERFEEKGIEVETDVLMGVPGREILGYVDDNGIDLIVMGTHGRRGIGRLLLGSTAERTVRKSDVPVLTTRMKRE